MGNLHVNFIVVYSPINITSLFYPVSKFSYFCICDTPLNCYYFTHQTHPFAHLTSFRGLQNSLSLSAALVSPAKMAESIEMPFGLRTRVGPGNHVLAGGPDPPMGRGNIDGERL